MSELKTFKADDEAYKKFKEICTKEGMGVGDKLNEFIKQYIKEHGDGNPAFTLDQFADPSFKVCPAFFRNKQTWKEYLVKLNKKERQEFLTQCQIINQAQKEAKI